jgi:hypothetical protein
VAGARHERHAEQHRRVVRADVAGRGRDERRDVRQRHHVEAVEQRQVHAGDAADHGVHAALDEPQHERQRQQRRAPAAPQAPRRREHARDDGARAPPRRRPAAEEQRQAAADREAAADEGERPPGHAERQVQRRDERGEDEAEGGAVEHALGDEDADGLAARRARAPGREERLHQVAGAGGQGVVAHVADRRQSDGVGLRAVAAAVAQQRAPAPAAQERGERVQRKTGAERGERGAGIGQLGERLTGRPPHDRRERDGRDGDLERDDARAGQVASRPR